jgi:2-phosphosulfolactate phosphatase
MEFIITNDQNLHKTKDELVVVIDVLRAFTTACYAMNNNPKDYIVTDDISLAYKMKKENHDCILIGERHGLKLPGFDYDSSPTDVKNVNFLNKTIIHTTTLGTRGIVNSLKHTKKVITGSFANAKAIINYIKKENPDFVYLFPTDSSTDDNEDVMFAKYIKSCFEEKPLNVDSIRSKLLICPTGGFSFNRHNIKHVNEDFSLAFDSDKFNFVLKAYLKSDGFIHLRRVNL